jgi:branched-chain amino acid transport system ATP-binding protein
MSLVTLNGVAKSHGAQHLFDGVDLQVSAGRRIAIIGPNGAGKTTLLRVISGLIPPKSGDLVFEERPIGGRPAYEIVGRGIAHVPEGRRIFPALTVADNLKMGAFLPAARRRFAESLARVYALFPVLAERQKQRAGSLSGGEQQMLAVGRALMSGPRLILLDEPSMGLAPMLVAEIFEIVSRLNREEGVAVLLAEQNATIALRFAQYGYVMENGRIVLDGDAKTISDNEDIKEFYLGLTGVGQRKSYRDVKHYRRRKRWLS